MNLTGTDYESLGTCFLTDVVDMGDSSRRFALTAHHCIVECESLNRIDALLLRFSHCDIKVKQIAATTDYLTGNDLALLELASDPGLPSLPSGALNDAELADLRFLVRGCASGMRTQFSNFMGTLIGVEHLRGQLSRVALIELAAETFAHNVLQGISGAPICALTTDQPQVGIVVVGVVREVASRNIATGRFYGSNIALVKSLVQCCNLEFLVVPPSEMPVLQASRFVAVGRLASEPSATEETRRYHLYIQSVISRWNHKTSPLLPANIAFPGVAVDLELRKRDSTKPILTEYSRDTYPLTLNRRLQLESLLIDELSPRNLFILGDPGGGKTTLLQMVAARLAGRALESPKAWLPIIISLAEFGSVMSTIPTWSLNDAFQLQLSALGIAGPSQFLQEALDRGRIVLLLDGYDEIADNNREHILDRLVTPLRVHKHNCVTVSSRKVGFQSLKGFEILEIAPLTLEQQKQILIEICGPEQCASLLRFLAGNADLRDLASVPLTLTILAIVARECSSDLDLLMQSRCELLRTSLQLLLEGRHRGSKGTRDPVAAECVLAKLSFALHNEEAANEVYSFRQIQAKIDLPVDSQGKPCTWNDSKDFLLDITTHSGIIAPIDTLQRHYRYLHRWFREYLAALALSTGKLSDIETFIAERIGNSQWSEVFVLYAGMTERPNEYLISLLSGPRGTALRALAEVSTIDVEVALQVISLKPGDLRERRSVFRQLRTMLNAAEVTRLLKLYVESAACNIPRCDLYFVQEILEQIPLPAARDLLSHLFDHIDEPPDGLLKEALTATASLPYWCEIAEGAFEFGAASDDPLKPEWVPVTTIVQTSAFKIAVVPVTFDLYWKFDPKLAPPKNLTEVATNEEIAHHPVVNVSWYEATIFCKWLSRRYPGVRLPNEYEWEKAASWDQEAATKRRFPWGRNWDDQLLNSWHKGPNRSTPVGNYPSGASPCGALDMAGNVWEWCANWFFEGEALEQILRADGTVPDVIDEGRFRRVDRGGGWYHDVGAPATFLRAADDPADRFSHCGFRLVKGQDCLERDDQSEIKTQENDGGRNSI